VILTLVVSVLFVTLARESAAERAYFDITAANVRKIMVAVPTFAGGAAGQQGQAVAQLLTKGLELHGFIAVIDPARFGGSREADWKSLGADYVVMGQIVGDPAGLAIEGQILDVASNQLLAGRRFKGTSSQWEDMTLRLCDGLIEDFTGEAGVSRTSMALISDGTGRKEVFVTDILGRHPRQITRHNALCVSPRFSPDGNFLAYSTYHRGNQDLYITDLRQRLNLAPAFANDGRTMVVTLSKGGTPDLYTIDRKGNIIEQLTSHAGINVSPSFSPDGQSMAFVSDRSGKPNVYVMNMASRQVQRLTFKNSENSEPAWSPKGDEIAFTGLQGGTYQLFVMDRNGGNVRQLTSGGNYESPTWAPDGRLIAVTRKGGGSSKVCVVSKNGKDVRTLFNFKGNQSYPQWSKRLP
jgi:TolB protein